MFPDFSLLTPRLRLRPLTPEDAPALLRTMGDPVAMVAYERTFSLPDIQVWIEKNIRRYARFGAGLWAAELLENGEVIGQCGLVPQEVDGLSFWEIGYLCERRHWHRGYATEAARASRNYGFDVLSAPALYSIIKHDNQPSQNVARRVGMTPWKKVHYGEKLQDTEHILFRITREERPRL